MKKEKVINLVNEVRDELEMSIHYQMELEKLRRFNRIKMDYYLKNPKAIRYVPYEWAVKAHRKPETDFTTKEVV